MFTFFHPRPVVSRKEIPVLSVRQEVKSQITPNAVLVIRRTPEEDPPAPSEQRSADDTTGDVL
jgi:hypothetical protein